MLPPTSSVGYLCCCFFFKYKQNSLFIDIITHPHLSNQSLTPAESLNFDEPLKGSCVPVCLDSPTTIYASPKKCSLSS